MKVPFVSTCLYFAARTLKFIIYICLRFKGLVQVFHTLDRLPAGLERDPPASKKVDLNLATKNSYFSKESRISCGHLSVVS